MTRHSAGILLWKKAAGAVRVLLVHPGGPFWARRDAGAWSIPKGECGPGEDPLAVARREFIEELGGQAERLLRDRPDAAYRPLGCVKQPGGKTVTAFALEGDLDAALVVSNSFEMEWPPKSGRMCAFPEIDRAEWFTLKEAHVRILKGQRALLEALKLELKPE